MSCKGGPSALFRFSLDAPLYPLSRLRERCVYRATPEEHTRRPARAHTHHFHVVLMCEVELMGLLSFRQQAHLSKDRPLSIHLIAPGVWKHRHSSVDISSMRCLQAINVLLLRDLSPPQCFNQRVTADAALQGSRTEK